MNLIRLILKYISCLYHLVLGIFLSGLASLFLITHADNVRMTMVPLWKGDALKYWLLAFGLIGIFSALMALLGKIRVLLVIYSLVIFCLMVYGFFMGPHSFRGAEEAKGAAWLTFGALGSFLGSTLFFAKPSRG